MATDAPRNHHQQDRPRCHYAKGLKSKPESPLLPSCNWLPSGAWGAFRGREGAGLIRLAHNDAEPDHASGERTDTLASRGGKREKNDLLDLRRRKVAIERQ